MTHQGCDMTFYLFYYLIIKCSKVKFTIYPGEQCVEAVDFLSFCDVSIVLGNAL